MNWLELKADFKEKLQIFYKKEDIDTFFRILLEDYWGISRLDFFLNQNACPSLKQKDVMARVISELQTYKPIQYITEKAYCFDRVFKVNKNVLIPRPETEELIRIILDENQSEKIRLLDIGTGSGIIPITLNLENKNIKAAALDISELAIKVAKENAQNLNAQVDFFQVDILKPKQWSTFSDASLDLIVSNPPYVLELERKEMQPNVFDYEPYIALFVNNDEPLVFYESIIEFALKKLNPEGKIYFEINEKYGQELVQLLSKYFKTVNLLKDFRERNRFVIAHKLLL